MPPLEIEEEDDLELAQAYATQEIAPSASKDAQYPLKVQYCACTTVSSRSLA